MPLAERLCRQQKGTDMDGLRIPLRVVFYEEDGEWVAHCLEFDLVGVGESKEEAVKLLSDAIFVQIKATLKNNNPKNLFRPADSEYFQKFAAGADTVEGNLEVVMKKSKGIVFEKTESRVWRPKPKPRARRPRSLVSR